jgi:hypothetical protein
MSNHPLGERNATPEEVQLMEQLVERSNIGLVSMLDELYKFRAINLGNRPGT